MKTQKLKTIGRNLGVLSLTALMLASCGSDSNESAPAPVNNTTTTTNSNPVFNNTGINGNDASVWNSLKSQNSCPQGRMSDLTFQITGGNTYGNTIVQAQLQSGTSSGSVQASYYGISGNRDLLYVQKVANGNGATYNVVVSYCNWSLNGMTMIGDGASMSNFQVQNLVLNNGSNCTTGAVTAGYVAFQSQLAADYTNPQGFVPVQFASAGINCY